MSILEELTTRAAQRRRELDRLQGEAVSLAVRGRSLHQEILKLQKDVSAYEQVTALLNTIGEDRQNQAQVQIESLVTMGLQSIFGPELSFHVIQKENSKSAQVEFVLRSTLADDRIVETDVLAARGGGVSAVVGFLLRLVILLLSSPSQSKILVLDETFSHVSAEYLDNVAQFLKEITEKTNIQILMVTHQSELTDTADKVYRFSLDSQGYTKVESVL